MKKKKCRKTKKEEEIEEENGEGRSENNWKKNIRKEKEGKEPVMYKKEVETDEETNEEGKVEQNKKEEERMVEATSGQRIEEKGSVAGKMTVWGQGGLSGVGPVAGQHSTLGLPNQANNLSGEAIVGEGNRPSNGSHSNIRGQATDGGGNGPSNGRPVFKNWSMRIGLPFNKTNLQVGPNMVVQCSNIHTYPNQPKSVQCSNLALNPSNQKKLPREGRQEIVDEEDAVADEDRKKIEVKDEDGEAQEAVAEGEGDAEEDRIEEGERGS